MQAGSFIIYYNMVLVVLTFQFFWLLIGQRGKEEYFRALGAFRRPSTALSRYWQWRISSVRNAIIEGVVFIGGLLLILARYFEALPNITMLVVMLVIIGLPAISAGHSIAQTYRFLRIEAGVEAKLNESIDVGERVREIIAKLEMRGERSSGQVWLALFRIAQHRDRVGYEVMDALMEYRRVRQESGFGPIRRGRDDQAGPALRSIPSVTLILLH